MTNPFESIAERLANIENLLLEIKHKPEKKESENLNVKEASVFLKVSEQSVHNYIKKGHLPAQKVGRIYLIKRADIETSLKDVKSLKYKRD